jgi:hypothetical protein
MRELLSTIGAFGVVVCLFPVGLGAQGQQVPPPGAVEQNQLPTLSSVTQFEGAANRNCPTGAGMFALFGSGALLTIPQIPRVPKDRAIPADIDSDFFGNSIFFRTSALPDHSGKLFEFIGKTCTIEITIRYT